MNHDESMNPNDGSLQGRVRSCGRVDDYLNGDMSLKESTCFEAHVAHCAPCAEAIEQQRWIDGLLASPAAAQAVRTPLGVVAAATRLLVVERQRAIVRRLAWAAAAAVAIAATWQFAGRQSHDPPSAPPLAAAPHRTKPSAAPPGPPPLPSGTAPRGTFAASPDVIAIAMESEDAEVSIVKLYPTVATERRWRREFTLAAGRAGQDGG